MFLVTGMREAYVHGKDAATAIVSGYNHAVRVVVAAAIIMISVFGGFIFADSIMILTDGLWPGVRRARGCVHCAHDADPGDYGSCWAIRRGGCRSGWTVSPEYGC